MNLRLSALGIGIAIFVVAIAALTPMELHRAASQTFSNDAWDYHRGAIYLARSGFYSLDGEHPASAREPGYSFFLAVLYTVFGEGNRIAIFIAQAILYLTATLLFLREFRKVSSPEISNICGLFLLLHPAIIHILFRVNRESITLSMLLLLSTLLLALTRHRSWSGTVGAGLLMAAIVLTYFPFLFLPFFIAGVLWWLKVDWKTSAILICIPLICTMLWGMRNAHYGEWHIMEPYHTGAIWGMRAIQAENQTLMDPLRCLQTEYITQDWSNAPDGLCNSNDVRKVEWRESFPDTYEGQKAFQKEAQRRILANFSMYLWGSLFQGIQFHLPYVNGWGRIYNILASLGALIMYGGLFLFVTRIRKLWQNPYLLFVVIVTYATGIFSLTYGLPRFRMTVFFGYAALSAIGYGSLLRKYSV